MRPETKLAFDTSLYRFSSGLQDLASDLSALALESAQESEERITPYQMVVVQGTGVIYSETGRDIQEGLRWESPADVFESEATLAIREQILQNQQERFLIVWISSPDLDLGYSEGRLVIGYSQWIDNLFYVQSYGICTENSAARHLQWGKDLLTFSQSQKNISLKDADHLRTTPILINLTENDDPFDYLEEIINLPEIWARIKSGAADDLKEAALKKAQVIAQKANATLLRARTREDFVRVGAYLEKEMQEAMGYQFRAGACGGSLNSNIFSFRHQHISFKSGQLIVLRSEGVFVRNCPFCGRPIGKIIQPGYKCVCGEVYTGEC